MKNTNQEINTWIECPVKYDLGNAIRKYCIDNKLTIHKLESVPCRKDWVDKMVGNNRETVYFHISGDYDLLNNLKIQIERFQSLNNLK